jgi:hypothetical protein
MTSAAALILRRRTSEYTVPGREIGLAEAQ